MAWLIKRGPVYYIRYSIAGKKRKVSTNTDNFQLAKEKLRRFESAQARGSVVAGEQHAACIPAIGCRLMPLNKTPVELFCVLCSEMRVLNTLHHRS